MTALILQTAAKRAILNADVIRVTPREMRQLQSEEEIVLAISLPSNCSITTMTLERMDAAALQAAVHKAGESWLAEQSELSELSDADKRLRLGANPPEGEASLEDRERAAAINREAAGLTAVGAPASFDLRNVGGGNFITPVKDQGSCGSCVAFGSVATVEGTYRRQLNNPTFAVDLSEAHLFYCIARAQGRNCSNGWWCDKGLDAFKTDGVVDEACYPYVAGDQNCSNRCADWQNRLTRISGWRTLTSVSDMKEWIATKGPLSCAFSVYNDFYSYRSGVYRHVSGAFAGGHCVSCIGYNDAGRYWICKNSWGSKWGEKGFFRIGYGECGIDAQMWAVDGIIETLWINGAKVLGLWAIDQERNAWVYLDKGIGWRRIAFDSDVIFADMLTVLSSAKLTKSSVNVYLDKGVIAQAYVF
ncbi:MAG: C1 family peptidase [Cyanobacteriota bacterium]|nr:C1 family peptidase [Cyanobacteriota bacterium]